MGMSKLVTIHGVKGFIDANGTAQLNLEDVSRGLGFIDNSKGATYVKWDRVRRYLTDIKYSTEVSKESFIPENIFYRLAMKAKNETAELFQNKVADDILPTIRKTGGYVSNDDLFVQTYLPHADASTRLLFRATLETVRMQNATIAVLKPKADKYDEFLDSDGLTTMTVVGKQFLGDISAQKLNKFLCDNGILYKKKVDGIFLPRQGYSDYFRIHIITKYGEQRRSVKVTAAGIDFIIGLFRKEAIA